MQFPVAILGMFAVLGIGILILTRPKPKAPQKPRYLIIDTKEDSKD